MRRLLCLLLFCLMPALAAAQDDDDRGFLTGFLEQKLSGIGREVTISGFHGALSSRATFARMTIADAEGVWITLNDGAIQWTRSALLAGRVEIAELTAASIDLARAPVGSDGTTAEATPFKLPELPVSVSIGQLRAERLRIGEAVLGEEVSVAIEGSAQLAGGEGSADFSIRRVDGGEGELTFSGAFANATRMATVDLLAREGPGGIAATLLGLPGRPGVELALHGSGPIDNFSTELALATDGDPRLTGRAVFRAAAAEPGKAAARTFAANLSGDISPLLQPQYRAFFGNSVLLEVEGRGTPEGETDLTRLVLDSDGLDVSGRLNLSPARVPRAAALTIRFGLPGGEAMLLPLPGEPTYVRHGTVLLRFDRRLGDGWTLNGDLNGFTTTGLDIGAVVLDGAGRVADGDANAGQPAHIFGTLGFGASGVRFADPAIAEAFGPTLVGSAEFSGRYGQPLLLPKLTAQAGDLGLSGRLAFGRDGLDPTVEGALQLKAADMARFSALAARRIGGAADIALTGSARLLSGAFDAEATASGRNLRVDQPMADRLLDGRSEISLAARRDEAGITIERLDLAVRALTAHAQGTIASDRHDLTARLAFSDVSVIGAGFGGALQADASLAGPVGGRSFSLSGLADDLRLGAAVADPLLRGRSEVSLNAAERRGTFALTGATVRNPQLSLAVEGEGDTLDVAGRIGNIGLIVPEFPGPVTLAGKVTPGAADTGISLTAEGPGQSSLRAAGELRNDLSAVDLTLSGGGQSALLNTILEPRSISGPVRFDLRLSGAPALGSLSGRVSGDGLRLASPNERLSIENGQVTADIAGGKALVQGSATVRGGGSVRLSGPADLAPPFEAALSVAIDRARVSDPNLYDARISGNIAITGPLLGGAVIGGAVTLNETEIAVATPASDGGPVPRIVHLNEGAPSRATRARAGLGGQATGADKRRAVYGLDLAVSAPARIFVRGLGLDAEMGGTVHLRGTTDDVIPSGQFELIRGRIKLLGKRFVLGEGVVQLLGSLVPYLYFTASSDTFGSTATIVLDGPSTAPEVHFTSSDGLPEEEVLSQLLFGDSLERISTFQLAQLVQAVAEFSGRSLDVAERIRKNLKLDDLDIVADDQGNAAIKAGRYVSERTYVEGTVGADGKSRVTVDIDLNPDLTVRGTLGTDGQSGAGLFYSRDY